MSKLITPLIVLSVILVVVVLAVLKQDPDPLKDREYRTVIPAGRLDDSGPRDMKPGLDKAAPAAPESRDAGKTSDPELARELGIRDTGKAAPRNGYPEVNPDPAYHKPAYWGDLDRKTKELGQKRGDEVVMVDPGKTGDEPQSDEDKHLASLSSRDKQADAIRKALEGEGDSETAPSTAAKDRDGDRERARERNEARAKAEREAKAARAKAEREAREAKEAKERARKAKRSDDDAPTLREALRIAKEDVRRESREKPRRNPRIDAPRAPAPYAPGARVWKVQAGAYGDPARAERIGSLLRSMGVRYEITPVGTGTRTLYRVRTTGGMSLENAQRLSGDLERRGVPAKVLK